MLPARPGVPGSIDAQLRLRRRPNHVCLDRDYVHGVGIMGVHLHREAEIRRNAVGYILPGVAPIVAAVKSPVILEEKPLWSRRVVHDFVDTLAELRIPVLLGHELRADPGVSGAPALATIV